jgi:flagellin-specific chaperone FliS
MRAYGEVDKNLYDKVHKRYEGRYDDLVRAIVEGCGAELGHKAGICRNCGRIQSDEYLMSGGSNCVECENEFVPVKKKNKSQSNSLVKLQGIMTECGITDDMNEEEIYECLDRHYNDEYVLEMAVRIGGKDKSLVDRDRLYEKALEEVMKAQRLMAEKIFHELQRFKQFKVKE